MLNVTHEISAVLRGVDADGEAEYDDGHGLVAVEHRHPDHAPGRAERADGREHAPGRPWRHQPASPQLVGGDPHRVRQGPHGDVWKGGHQAILQC